MNSQALVPPVVIFFVVAILLIVARIYDRLPIQFPACTFRKTTGIPCLACRGTRSLQALTQGRVTESFRLNPLAATGVLFTFVWVSGYVLRKGKPPRNSLSHRWIIVITTGLLVGNWIYLLLTDHWYP